jgi:hypothetical protein
MEIATERKDCTPAGSSRLGKRAATFIEQLNGHSARAARNARRLSLKKRWTPLRHWESIFFFPLF